MAVIEAKLVKKFSATHSILCLLFFFSGCSALIYQVIWQRMLFALFGVDLESVTVIVAVFMFGLGVGGICGGLIADWLTKRLLLLYVGIELGIALFGFLSPDIISALGTATLSSSEFVTAALCFVILAIPSILMGATFPILVAYVHSDDKHIGRAVGSLYFANTLGGASGAYVSGFILLYYMGLSGAVNCAALLNLSIAASALILLRRKN